jgi:hypothetical protein
LQTSQGYIIRILQHFATKLWNITNFVMLFQAVMKFLSRLVDFKMLVNWGMVHWATIMPTQLKLMSEMFKTIKLIIQLFDFQAAPRPIILKAKNTES